MLTFSLDDSHDAPDVLTGSVPADGLCRALLAVAGQHQQGLALKDADGRYLWVNTVLAGWMGRPAADWAGRTDLELLGGALGAEVRAGDLRALGAGGVSAGEYGLEQGGQRRVFKTLRTALVNGDSSAPLLLTAWWDDGEAREQSSRLKRALSQIEQQQAAFEKLDARYRDGQDRPSQAFRSESFEEHLRRELALSSREHREFALAVLVLEGVDRRQAYGPESVARVADTILHMLRANTRSMDMICRVGLDRFGILLSGVGLATAHTRMEQFRRQCATHWVVHEGVSIQFQVSAGVASFPHTAQTLDELSAAAEQALAEATRQGGHKVCLAAIALPETSPALRASKPG